MTNEIKEIKTLCFIKYVKYNLLRALPALVLAAAGVMVQSCDSDNEDDLQPVPTRDIILDWNIQPEGQGGQWFQNIGKVSKIEELATNPTVRAIYLNLLETNDFSSYTETWSLNGIRGYLQQRVDVSPKVHGRGNLNNVPMGVMEKSDSLWFVQNGWTVNQR